MCTNTGDTGILIVRSKPLEKELDMNTTTGTDKTTHIIHISGKTAMEGIKTGGYFPRRVMAYTIIECHIREGVLVTYDNVCPSCHQEL